jgi:hypothetical protein
MTSNLQPGFRPISGVYALVDPRTDRVMYIGQSVDIDYRYRQHCNPNPKTWDGNLDKRRWIDELKALGKKPTLRILSECRQPEMDQAEIDLLRDYKAKGQAELNMANGGPSRSASKIDNAHLEEWFQFGRKVKAARELLVEIAREGCQLAGKRGHDPFSDLALRLDKAKWKLETLLLSKFPEWEGLSHVLCGPDDDEAASMIMKRKERTGSIVHRDLG